MELRPRTGNCYELVNGRGCNMLLRCGRCYQNLTADWSMIGPFSIISGGRGHLACQINWSVLCLAWCKAIKREQIRL